MTDASRPPVRPMSPRRLVAFLTHSLAARQPGQVLRVAIDGAPPADPGALADTLLDPLRAAGRPALRVPAAGFLRPASLRWERGRTDPDSLYEDWLDLGALRREVLAPLAPGGNGAYLPALWDPLLDRSARQRRTPAPPGAVVVVDGSFLLGCGLPFDLTVHLHLSPAALRRRLPPDLRWTEPAYARYEAEASPASIADIVVGVDDPRHPALIRAAPGPVDWT